MTAEPIYLSQMADSQRLSKLRRPSSAPAQGFDSQGAEETMTVSSPKRALRIMTRCHMTFTTLADKELGVPSGLPAYL